MKKTMFIVFCILLMLSVSCSPEQAAGKTTGTDPAVKNGQVTKEQWDKAFAPAAGDIGFESVTVESEELRVGNGWLFSAGHSEYKQQWLMTFKDGKWYYKCGEGNWTEYTDFASLEDEIQGAPGIDETFDEVMNMGSQASLAYVCRYRNLRTIGSELPMIRCYNEQFFDEVEGVYKFKIAFNYKDYENHIYPVPLSFEYPEDDPYSGEYQYNPVIVKFNSDGLLTSVELHTPNPESTYITTWTFSNYNSTEKPSDISFEI